ncbi:hypothetical protein K438DRAFT_631520 [Mycena galopus ATCC 62051]|nr:hypothetical protein K438DRAFT_631520 [Mycena galopus ATCC 62051]
MSVDYANNVTPASKRSPTQRHMHNYSLPSPFCAPRPTTPRPTRCRSSPALSEFRQAVYIQGPSDFRSAEETPPREEGALVVAPLKLSRKSPHTGGAAQFGTTCSPTTAALGPAGSDPGLHRVLSSSPPTSRSLTSTPSQRQKRAAHSPAFSYDSPPSYPSPRRPSTSPSRAVAVKLNRLSAASITSLPFLFRPRLASAPTLSGRSIHLPLHLIIPLLAVPLRHQDGHLPPCLMLTTRSLQRGMEIRAHSRSSREKNHLPPNSKNFLVG